MAEVTWKTTFIGAFILFLIGLIVATCLNYARPAFTSIHAGISGPFECYYSRTVNRSILCTEVTVVKGKKQEFYMKQDCVYILVTYGNGNDSINGKPIKLAPNYKYNQMSVTLSHQRLQTDGGSVELGRCSANYCGDYRFKDDNAQYKRHPELINTVNKARETDGLIKCYLNPEQPSNGAYLRLNDENIESPEHRMFRWYEGYMLLIAPLALCLALIIYMTVTFIRQRKSAKTAQQPREAFVPPGFASATPTQELSIQLSHEEEEAERLTCDIP